MAIDIVDLPIKRDDFPVRYVSLPGRVNGFDKPQRTWGVWWSGFTIRSLRIHLQYSSLGLARNAWQHFATSETGFEAILMRIQVAKKYSVNIWLIYEYCICLTWMVNMVDSSSYQLQVGSSYWTPQKTMVWWAKETRWSTNFNRRLEVNQIGLPVLKLFLANGDSVSFEDSLI